MAVSVYIPTNSARGLPFFHTLSVLIVCRPLDDSHSEWCEVIFHCSFDLHFSNNEHLFMCLLAICMSSLEKCLFRSFPHFFNRVVYFSGIELYELLVYFGNESLVSCFIYYCFLPFCRFSFHLAYRFLCCAKVFKFNQVRLV